MNMYPIKINVTTKAFAKHLYLMVFDETNDTFSSICLLHAYQMHFFKKVIESLTMLVKDKQENPGCPQLGIKIFPLVHSWHQQHCMSCFKEKGFACSKSHSSMYHRKYDKLRNLWTGLANKGVLLTSDMINISHWTGKFQLQNLITLS